MKRLIHCALALSLLMGSMAVLADEYGDTESLFRQAGASAGYFSRCYGYAVFPMIAKGGLGVGAAHGLGHVYEHGRYVGEVSMTQVSFGLQAGGEAFRQIIFFEDRRAFEDFTRGDFEFGADVSAVAITAAAGGSAGTTGVSAGASGTQQHARTAGGYYKGMAVFTIATGGLMYQAAVAGEKFSFKQQ